MSSSCTSTKCRFGFMSTANIAGKYKRALDICPNAELYAIASRSLDTAKAWAEKNNVKVYYGSYDELLADTKIDAVYMPLPCALHQEWAIKAAEAGKAILIEKPTAISSDSLSLIIQACVKNNVQFMDGTMFNHHERLNHIRQSIDSFDTPILRMTSGFSFLGDNEFLTKNIRVQKPLEPFGSLGDLGWYSIRFCLWAMNYSLPLYVRAKAHTWSNQNDKVNGVPIDVTAQLFFNGKEGEPSCTTVTFDCGFTTPFRQWMEVSTAKGHVTLDDFVISRSHGSCEYTVNRGPDLDEFHSNVIGEKERIEIKNCNQEMCMLQTFADRVLQKKIDMHWPRISLLTQIVLDACMDSIQQDGKDVAVTRKVDF